jgi:hypothetical protein
MNRLVGVLFVTVVGCAPVVAQQSNKQFDAQVTPAVRAARQGQEAPAPPTFVFNPTFKWPFELFLSKTSTQQRTQPQVPIVIAPPQFVVKDGALYLDVLGNGILLPVPGGGASGCFNWNLHERIEKLKTVIESLPPSLQPTIPRL